MKKTAAAASAGGKHKGLNFEFLQKLGKALMVVIAVMPAAGLMISLGNIIQIFGADVAMLVRVGTIVANIGWGVINNLNLLFAVAIGGSWAKERAGGAFAAVIAFVLINLLTGSIFGVTADMLNTEGAVTTTLFGQEIEVADYFTSILGAPALNMGVFIGIIAGFLGATVYNKYYNYRGLPDVLSFFNGKRFVPLVVMVWSVVISIVLAIVWPVIQGGINAFGIWIANSSETSPILAPFIYGTLERLLLPFGLHHMLTIPMNYTSFGGTYTILTGANAGTQVFGQDPLWLAWVTDLINLKNAGDLAGYENLLTTVTPRPLQSGPDDRRHRPADRHRPGHAAPGGPRQAQELPLHVHLHHRRGPADRRHRAAGVHVHVLRHPPVRGLCGAAGRGLCHGRRHPPAAALLRQPGAAQPPAHELYPPAWAATC